MGKTRTREEKSSKYFIGEVTIPINEEPTKEENVINKENQRKIY